MTEEKIITPVEKYYADRMALLGITDENNKIGIVQTSLKNSQQTEIVDTKIFTCGERGIDILVYTIDKMKINYAKEGQRWKTNEYKITRLFETLIKKDGSEQKYHMPPKQPVQPFFPPALCDKYERKETIDTLYLTEGYFKAFKACMHGIYCVGLPSITCMKDRETGELHSDIKNLVKTCKISRLVWLVDGDCRNITSKEITSGIDLYKRPQQFFKTVAMFHDLTSNFDNIQKYFAHINSDNIEGTPKGLDDLLIALPDETKEIAKEFNSFNKKNEQLTYLYRTEITYNIGKIHRYFLLHDVDQFYLYHIEKRPELKNKEFKFNGTLYYWDDKETKCIIKVPSSAANYFRAGDDYYEFVRVPDKYENQNLQYHKRRKETIKDDNGKEIFNHIPKYKGFVNIPEHLNYQRIIHNFFNTYHPFTHEPEDGDCDLTIEFLKHIFGTEKVSTKEGKEFKRYELALDYLTILYTKPQQILPILCLVSTERQTGKTTFIKWLKLLYGENMAIVGNQDFENNFNSHWASKLIIACDETKIEKHVVMERIKGLSTAGSIMKESKGQDQLSMDFFGKFILLSNNEDNFATIDREEIRFWVIKVPTIKGKRIVELEKELKDEIPAFLHYLTQRKIVTENVERHWFDTDLLRTEALKKIIDNSAPTIQKIFKVAVTELFNSAIDYDTITMPLDAIAKELLRGKYERNYVKETLNDMGYVTDNIQRKSYPRMIEKYVEGRPEIVIESVRFHNRFYEFKREDFTNERGTQTNNNNPKIDLI